MKLTDSSRSIPIWRLTGIFVTSAPLQGRSGTHRYPSATDNFGEYSVSRSPLALPSVPPGHRVSPCARVWAFLDSGKLADPAASEALNNTHSLYQRAPTDRLGHHPRRTPRADEARCSRPTKQLSALLRPPLQAVYELDHRDVVYEKPINKLGTVIISLVIISVPNCEIIRHVEQVALVLFGQSVLDRQAARFEVISKRVYGRTLSEVARSSLPEVLYRESDLVLWVAFLPLQHIPIEYRIDGATDRANEPSPLSPLTSQPVFGPLLLQHFIHAPAVHNTAAFAIEIRIVITATGVVVTMRAARSLSLVVEELNEREQLRLRKPQFAVLGLHRPIHRQTGGPSNQPGHFLGIVGPTVDTLPRQHLREIAESRGCAALRSRYG